jgi:transcriptional regulator with XRE-family HTH domain
METTMQSSGQEQNYAGLFTNSDGDREVIRCGICRLVQYRTRTGDCRKCLQPLPPPHGSKRPKALPNLKGLVHNADDQAWHLNSEIVKDVGRRIRAARESLGLARSQMERRTKISRSYFSRTESGKSPSCGMLEKIVEEFGISMNVFLSPENEPAELLCDPFIRGIGKIIVDRQRRLTSADLASIVKIVKMVAGY